MPNRTTPEKLILNIPAATDRRSVWLRAGTILDGTGTTPLRNIDVVYNREAIQFVGNNPPPNMIGFGQRQPDLDLPNCTLLPGLIEAHAHLFLEGGERNSAKRSAYQTQTPELLLKLARQRLERLVRLGIAGIRDAGDKRGVGLALSKLYWSTERPLMPYVESPGAAIHRKGRYGSFMAEAFEKHITPTECVEALVRAGGDRIKLIATGIVDFEKGSVPARPQFTTEEIREFVTAARALNRQTFAHASGDEGIGRAVEGGVDSVEHGFFVRPDQLAQMRDRQTAWVPTFAPVQKQLDHAAEMGWDQNVVSNLRRILERHSASLARAHEMGALIVAGSDAGSCGVAHGEGLLYELELMERAGLPALAVINAATGNGSKRLGYREPLGQIKPGYRSRFIITTHSPLDGVKNLRRPRIVIFDGEPYAAGEDWDASGM